MRLATYNIHRAVGTDGRRDLDRIIAVIDEINPHVIALQEVDSRLSWGPVNQAAVIANRLGMRCIEGPILVEGDGWYGNAILTRRPVREIRRWRFADHSGEQRGAIGIMIVDSCGRNWHIVTMHLDLFQRCRLQQIRALVRFLEPAPAWPRVILGDVNEWWPWSPSWPILRGLGEVPRGKRTFPSWCPILRLDRVIAQGCILRGPLRRHVTAQSRCASDHLPVFVDVEV